MDNLKNKTIKIEKDTRPLFYWEKLLVSTGGYYITDMSDFVYGVMLNLNPTVIALCKDTYDKYEPDASCKGYKELTFLLAFFRNAFPLQLPNVPELNGKYFKDLDRYLQRRIENQEIVLSIYDKHITEEDLAIVHKTF